MNHPPDELAFFSAVLRILSASEAILWVLEVFVGKQKTQWVGDDGCVK